MHIPENTPAIQLTGILVNLGEASKGSKIAQILFSESHMGISNKVHLIDCWNPTNFEELQKCMDKPVTFPALKAQGDRELYRIQKGTAITPVKG